MPVPILLQRKSILQIATFGKEATGMFLSSLIFVPIQTLQGIAFLFFDLYPHGTISR